MRVDAIVLAAGRGTRMRSDLPKPLHLARGRTLLGWVVHALDDVELSSVVVVVGHGRELVVDALAASFDRSFLFAEQTAQRGTGDATAVGLAQLDIVDGGYGDDDHVIVLPGDTPLLTSSTIAELVRTHVSTAAAATVVTAVVDDPTGYGRIVRSPTGAVSAIVEHRDATTDQRSIREINGGIYCFRRSLLAPALRMISTDNDQGELYLTDAIGVLGQTGHAVLPFPADPVEIAGVNDRAQLGDAAEQLGANIANAHMTSGVTIMQPSSTVIDASVSIEPDVTVLAGCVLEGSTSIAAGAVIGPNTRLVNAIVGEGAIVEASTVRDATVAAGQIVGPYQVIGAR